MWLQSELVRLLIEHQHKLIRLLGAHERKVDVSTPDELPVETAPRPKFKPGSQEWYKSLPAPRTEGVSMNSIARSVPRPQPPRAPGRQSRRFNGSWWHY
jgi:hypothetical protein